LNDFINIIERKGYEWEILEEQKKEKANKYDYITRKEGITNAEIFEDINKIDEEFIKLHFRKEYIIDNYKKINSKDTVKKDLENNLLGEKIDKINEIFKMFKDNEGNKKELKADELRKILRIFLKNPYLRNLFKTLPNGNNPREIFNNVDIHILEELGMAFIKTRRRYKDETTGKRKEEYIYNKGYGEIL
jgi:hypothetical protein